MTQHDLDDLILSGDIADMLGVGQPAVSNWKARHEDFPAPLKVMGGRTSLYSRIEVIEWYRTHYPGRLETRVASARALIDSVDNGAQTA